MSWRNWTVAKLAVFGACFGIATAFLGALGLYIYNRPQPWNVKALSVAWTDRKYLLGDDGQVTFLFHYGVRNNTARDHELHKDRITIMSKLRNHQDSLTPAESNVSLGRDSFFLPAQHVSFVEVRFTAWCSNELKIGTAEKREERLERDAVRKCFEQVSEELSGLVVFDHTVKYRLDLEKPTNKTQ